MPSDEPIYNAYTSRIYQDTPNSRLSIALHHAAAFARSSLWCPHCHAQVMAGTKNRGARLETNRIVASGIGGMRCEQCALRDGRTMNHAVAPDHDPYRRFVARVLTSAYWDLA